MPKQLGNGFTPNGIYTGEEGQTGRECRKEKLLPTSENQGQTWVPCYISSVERLILPVCRIRFLICSEGFSCQSLNVLKPNKATSSISSSSIFLTVGQKKVKKKKGAALRNLPVAYFPFSET